jgi:DNA repair protein RecO (recombination protein O)
MEYKYTTIVLGKKEVGETDRLYTFYTKEAGKIQVIANGVRKPQAKLASQLENGSLVGITVVRTRGTGKLAGAVLEKDFATLRTEYEVYQAILTALERIRLLTEADESQPELFDLLLEFLQTSEKQLKKDKKEEFFFLREGLLLKAYALLGYRINTTHCLTSNRLLARGIRYVFSPKDGGFLEKELAGARPGVVAVSDESMVLLRAIMTNSLSSLLKIVGAEKETKTLDRIGESFYQWTIRH